MCHFVPVTAIVYGFRPIKLVDNTGLLLDPCMIALRSPLAAFSRGAAVQ